MNFVYITFNRPMTLHIFQLMRVHYSIIIYKDFINILIILYLEHIIFYIKNVTLHFLNIKHSVFTESILSSFYEYIGGSSVASFMVLGGGARPPNVPTKEQM